MEEFVIEHGTKRIYGMIAYPEGQGPWPLVIFSHGIGASRIYEGGMERQFVEAGLAFAAFDFCGGGQGSRSSGTMQEMSVLTEADDLSAVMDWARGQERVDRRALFLLGSSQGGYVSMYVASERPDDVAALGLFFPAFCIGDDARARTERNAGVVADEVHVGPNVVGRRYDEDALSVDIFARIREYAGDVFIIHGNQDTIVPVEYARRAAQAFPGRCDLEIIEGFGHGFRSAPPSVFEHACDVAVRFFREHL